MRMHAAYIRAMYNQVKPTLEKINKTSIHEYFATRFLLLTGIDRTTP